MSNPTQAFNLLASKIPKRYGLFGTKYLLGIIQALAAGDDYIESQVEAVRDNLIAVTATGRYLDVAAARYGIVRGQGTGLLDPDFQKLVPVMGMSAKQITKTLLQMIDIFYGPYASHANTTAEAAEPYNLNPGDTLIVRVDSSQVGITFTTSDFVNIHAATAQEIATAISQKTQGILIGSVVSDVRTGKNFINVRTGTIGSQGFVQVLGGSSQRALEFPEVRPLTGTVSTWSVTRYQGTDQMVYQVIAGPIPNFGTAGVSSGDFVTISPESGFALDNCGTFKVTFVGPDFIRVENPIGSPEASVTNNFVDDFTFFRPDLGNVLLSARPAALVETSPRQLIVIIPVTSPVVKRTLKGGHHFHNGVSQVLVTTPDKVCIASDIAFDTPSGAIRPMGSRLNSSGVVDSISGNTVTLLNSQNWPTQGAFWASNLREFFYYEGISGNVLQNVTPTPPAGLVGVTVKYTERYLYTGIASSLVDISNLQINLLCADFNSMLVELDNDTGISDTDYSATLNIGSPSSANFVTNFNLLLTKLDNDSGVADTNYSSLWLVTNTMVASQLVAQFNGVMTKLDVDSGVTNTDYELNYDQTPFTGPTLTGVFPDPTKLLGKEVACAGAQSIPNFPGSFMFDPGASFTVAQDFTQLGKTIEQGDVLTLMLVDDVSTWPTSGSFVVEYGTEREEGPIKYFATVGTTGLIVDPSHVFNLDHLKGVGIRRVGTIGGYTPRTNGQDYAVYTTSTSPARDLLAKYLRLIAAAGVQLQFQIRVPDEKWPVLPNLYTTDPMATSLVPPV